MSAQELINKNAERIKAHLAGFNPDTGVKYEIEPAELIQSIPTIAEIKELIANGQPVNSLLREYGEHAAEDEEGACDDDAENDRRAEEAFKKAENEIRFDEPLMAMAYVQNRMNSEEWREAQNATQDNKQPTPEPGPGPDSGPDPGPDPGLDAN